MRPRAVVRAAHLWAGLALSLLLLVLGATGSALVYKDAYWRLVYPELREAATLTPDRHAAAIAAAQDRFGDALRSIKLPEPGIAAYHLYLADGEAFLGPGDHRRIDRWRPRDRLMPFLFDLHAHLMAGEGGERVGGVAGLLGAVMILTGVYLWWPARRRFRVRTLLPHGLARRKLLPSHRDLGLVAAPVLLLLLVTGSGMVFYGTAGAILNGILPGPPPVPESAPVAVEGAAEAGADGARSDGVVRRVNAEIGRPPSDRVAPAVGAVATAGAGDDVERTGPDVAGLIRRAEEEFPGARIVFYYPPDEDGIHGFRLRQPCEVHPNGRSYVYMTGGGRVLRSVDACAQPAGQRALYAVYPLHAGKLDSGTYRLLVFLGGLALTLVSATGAAAYMAKLAGAR